MAYDFFPKRCLDLFTAVSIPNTLAARFDITKSISPILLN